MAISPSSFLITAAILVFFTQGTLAATVTHNWNISWVPAAPFKNAPYYRNAMGINGQWPIPPLFVTKGDTLIINVYNGLGNETTSIHYHGIFQNGTTDMDGASQVSQCAIQPGGSFTYNFTVNQPGTYWFHSHVRAQYPDGLRAPLIVHDPESPFLDMYNEEVILSLSDWYVTNAHTLMKSFVSYTNPTGAEPVPDAALMNDTQNLHIDVQAGKTYFFRIVNMAAFAGMYVWIEGHTMQIIEVDGVYTKPTEVEMFYITPAQRYGVLVTMKNETRANYPIIASMDTVLFDKIPPTLNWNVTGWLVYNNSNPLPDPMDISEYNPFDDVDLVPYDQEPLFENPDHTMTLNFEMANLGDGANYAFINNISYVQPNVPTLYTALTSGSKATSPEIYGTYTNTFVLNRYDVVEIVLNNLDTNKHPFHLHGHNFQAIFRSDENAGSYDPTNATEKQFPQFPMRRDTFMVKPGGNYVLRFRADNPGVWLYHCHIEWHTSTGLISTLVEAPLDLQSSLKVPEDHFKVCQAQAIPTAGNAAGNTVDLFDLTGEDAPPPPLPAGFTSKGIVALVFSCLSAFAGIAVITWYGMVPITNQGTENGVVVERNEHVSSNGSTDEVSGTVEQISEVPKMD